MTFDQLAARILLSNESQTVKQAALRGLAVRGSIAVGAVCPECGGADTEDNGGTEYRCIACDHRWGFEYGERYGF